MPITDHDALAAALADHAPFAAVYGDLDPQTLPVAGLMHAAVAAKRLVAHAQAFQARVFAAAERVIQAQDAGSSRGRGAVESQVGATLHLPPATLRGLLGECGALCERFPEAFALLRRGAVSWCQVKPLPDLTSCMSEGTRARCRSGCWRRCRSSARAPRTTGCAARSTGSTPRAPRNATRKATCSAASRCCPTPTGWPARGCTSRPRPRRRCWRG